MTETIFRDREPGIANFKNSAHYVLGIPLLGDPANPEILFEIRGAISQAGDVCLPGGRVEDGEDLTAALRREMAEELLVPEENIEVVGPSDVFISEWGRIIHPYVVRLKDYEGTFFEDEVAEVFRLPLAYFLENEPRAYSVSMQETPGEDFPFERISGGKDYGWHASKREVLFYDYEEHTVWGLTAKIMKRFAEIIKEQQI